MAALYSQSRAVTSAHGLHNLAWTEAVADKYHIFRQIVPGIKALGVHIHSRRYEHAVRREELLLAPGVFYSNPVRLDGQHLGRALRTHRLGYLLQKMPPVDIRGILGKSVTHLHNGDIFACPGQIQSLLTAS